MQISQFSSVGVACCIPAASSINGHGLLEEGPVTIFVVPEWRFLRYKHGARCSHLEIWIFYACCINQSLVLCLHDAWGVQESWIAFLGSTVDTCPSVPGEIWEH